MRARPTTYLSASTGSKDSKCSRTGADRARHRSVKISACRGEKNSDQEREMKKSNSNKRDTPAVQEQSVAAGMSAESVSVDTVVNG